MQPSKLLWGAVLVAAVVAVGAGLCAVNTRMDLSAAQDRIDRLERDFKAMGGTRAKGVADEVEKLRTQVGDLEKSLALAHDAAAQADKHASEVAATSEKKFETIEQRVASAPTGGGGGVDAATLEEVVSKKLEEKGVGHKDVGDDGKRKPPLTELSHELGLSPAQEDAVAEAVNAGKKRLSELLQIRRADGKCMMDDFVAVFTDPENAKNPEGAKVKMGELFQRLFTEPIPGRGEPYIGEIVRLQNEVKRQMAANMSADQYKQFERSNIDVNDIQTGYDPFAEYVASHPR